MNYHGILYFFHTLSAIVWIGGMFFAHVILRPALMQFDPAVRLPVWKEVFTRFFAWVWVALIAILISGLVMIFAFFGGFAELPVRIHIMTAGGIFMMINYSIIYFLYFPAFVKQVENKTLKEAAASQAMIRKIVLANLIIGVGLVAEIGIWKYL